MRASSLVLVGGLAVSLSFLAGEAAAQVPVAPVAPPSAAPKPPLVQPPVDLQRLGDLEPVGDPKPFGTSPFVEPQRSGGDAAAIPSFSQLFRSVGQDFRNLPSRENALLLTIGAGVAGLSTSVERDLTASWTRPGPEDTFFASGSLAGNSYLHLGAAFALYGVGRATDNSRLGRFGADLARAQIVAQGTTYALKFAANRTRPNGEVRSFPSGHSATAFATATVVKEHFGWKAGIPAYAAAAFVGASRIQDNKHFLSDVAFGAALGIIAGRTVTVGTRSVKFALAPVSGPGGGVGIGFTRVK